MKRIKVMMLALMPLLAFAFASCKDKQDMPTVEPISISNLRYETTPGQIVLHWDKVEEAGKDLLYVRVSYFDPYTNKNTTRLTSNYSTSCVIPKTFKVAGEYTFTVTVVSSSGKEGASQTLKATSAPVAPVTSFSTEAIPLTVAMLSTNAQEPSEGPIANLIDGNDGTYFHSRWSAPQTTDAHYLQIAIPQEQKAFKFWYKNRNNGNGKPQDIIVSGSENGEDWRELTRINSGLPTGASSVYDSQPIDADPAIKHLRLTVMRTNSGAAPTFFNMAEFKLYKVIYQIYDAEAEAKKIIDSYGNK
ncbi:discoidin domain-containing protein [Porphyromonas canoris]|uniref:discoidin domain-containing protein n=1 Tax=Porphyromonas canoris TaxID=36875 RepID=UPI0009E5484E|nr:discoidin domain-containing protein [Porphyromonas canoris]